MTTATTNLHPLLFGIRRSARYHNRRRRFFDNMHRLKTALSLLAGSAAMVAIMATTKNDNIALAASAIVTFVSTIDLVVGSTTRARLHADLARRFIDLERAITLAKDQNEADIQEWTAQRLLIEADEPPILRVLDILCQNELLLAMGYERTELYGVPWHKRWFAPFFNIRDENIQRLSDTSQTA